MSDTPSQILVDGEPIMVLRSERRRSTVSLERDNGRYVLRAPARLTADEVQRLAERLLQRYRNRTRRRALNADQSLQRRAAELNAAYFGGSLQLKSIMYVTNQRTRYGSCTPMRGAIRLSDELTGTPAWVRDYVIVHELAHLHEANHGPAFWQLVNRYPLAERARGYLMALGMEPLPDVTESADTAIEEPRD